MAASRPSEGGHVQNIQSLRSKRLDAHHPEGAVRESLMAIGGVPAWSPGTPPTPCGAADWPRTAPLRT